VNQVRPWRQSHLENDVWVGERVRRKLKVWEKEWGLGRRKMWWEEKKGENLRK